MDNAAPQNINPNTQTQPVQPVQVPPPQDPTNQNTSGKKKLPLKVIIAVIVFLLLAGGAAAGYVYKEQIMTIVSPPTPTPTIVQTPTPTPDPTADWNTFTDAQRGVSFKYPNEYIANKNHYEYFIAEVMSSASAKLKEEVTEDELRLEIFHPYRTDKSLSDIVKDKINNPDDRIPAEEFEDRIIHIDGQEAVILKSKSTEEVYLIKNEKLLRIIKYPTVTKRQGEFEMILSSLKYSPKNIETLNWKTFTFPVTNIQFQYPQNAVTESTNTSFRLVSQNSTPFGCADCSDKLTLLISIEENANNKTLKELTDAFILSKYGQTVLNNYTRTKEIINGRETLTMPGDAIGMFYFFKMGSYFVALEAGVGNIEPAEKLELIMESFKEINN